MLRPLTFYDLPLKARRLVYDYLGWTGCTVDLNYNQLILFSQGRYPDREHVRNVFCFHNGTYEINHCEEYHTLAEYWTCERNEFLVGYYYPRDCGRYSCRGIVDITDWLNGSYGSREEAPEPWKILLRSNHFRICRSSPYGFAPFFNMSSDMLRDLGTLTVRLDGEPIESVKIGGCWERLEELLPLNLSSRYGKYGLREWERLVQRLAECIRPDHLTLYLIVNVKDIATAQTVLMPLYQLPRLKECGLWLNKEHIPELSMLAQDTVRRLKKPVHTDQPFKYLDLPIETRWRILEYSDLVYDKALEWKPRLSSLGRMPRPNCSCIEYVHGYMVDEGLHLPDCTTSDMDATELQDMDDWKTEYSAEHCCYGYKNRSRFHCKVTYTGSCECIFNCKHSAYSSGFMLGPRDGAHPLFLVSKQVHQDAVPIFFQRNRFLVLPPGKAYAYRPLPVDWPPDWWRRVIIPMHRLEISLFLSSVARNALQHIRYLEWLLPQFKNYTTAPKSAYLDYLDTIELMAQAMNLPLLTLVVDLRMEYPYRDWESDWESYLGRHPADGAVYDRILQPLCRLEGLKDFFVYLRRVKKSVPAGVPRYHLRRAYDDDERKYEKAVMGANYDSRRRAKPWMNRFETKMWRYRDRGDEYERWRSRDYSNYDPGMDEW